MSGAALAARGLSKRFGGAPALDAVDLDLAPGRALAVLGPNGAGKSTLLRLVAGLTRPSAGTLTLDGASTHQRAARARIGYVGHATLLYDALTARENLVFAARLHGVADPAARAAALLADEGLGEAADREVGSFSRGMAQRVAIARGLVHDPAVLLLDEPFTGLDHRAADRLAARLAGLRDAGRTLLLATHEIARAAALADAALVLEGGRVAWAGAERLSTEALERAYLDALDAAS